MICGKAAENLEHIATAHQVPPCLSSRPRRFLCRCTNLLWFCVRTWTQSGSMGLVVTAATLTSGGVEGQRRPKEGIGTSKKEPGLHWIKAHHDAAGSWMATSLWRTSMVTNAVRHCWLLVGPKLRERPEVWPRVRLPTPVVKPDPPLVLLVRCLSSSSPSPCPVLSLLHPLLVKCPPIFP
eukprot:3086251-Amphidinium_carterae.1